MIRYLRLPTDKEIFEQLPWVAHHYHVRDIVHGKLLMEYGEYKKGYQLLEKGWYEALHKNNVDFIAKGEFIKTAIESDGLAQHRSTVFSFIDLLPDVNGQPLNLWIEQANARITASGSPIVLQVKEDLANITIADLFASDIPKNDELPFYYGTIHSVKGKTFDAILVLLGERSGTAHLYTTLLNNMAAGVGEHEEMRIVYVGLTRPRKILMLAVPNNHLAAWSGLLGV